MRPSGTSSLLSHRPLSHATAHSTQPRVHFAGRRTKDERYNRISRNLDILERAKNVNLTDTKKHFEIADNKDIKRYLRVGENDTCATSVLNGEFCLAILAGNAPCNVGNR